MGFRCPACTADFGTDRGALKEHLQVCAAGRALVSAVLNVSEDKQSQDALGVSRPETTVQSD